MRCRTLGYWVDGYVDAVSRRLVDFLNSSAASQFVAVEDASVSIGSDPQQTSFKVGSMEISTSTILMAIPVEDAPRPPDFALRMSRKAMRVVVAVGSYQIVGESYLPRDRRGGGILRSTDSQFIVVADAKVKQLGTDSVEQYSAVCVNRDRIELIGSID